VAECTARKTTPRFNVAGAEVKEIGTGAGSEELGTEELNWSRMALQLT